MKNVLPLFVFFLLSTVVSTTRGQGLRPGPEDDLYPLGGIEAMGEVVDFDDGRGIIVRKVFEGGLAEKGKLEVGEIILAVDGKRLTGNEREMIAALENGIEVAEGQATQSNGRGGCNLTVSRGDGKKVVRVIPVRKLGAHSKSCPDKCPKCQAVLDEALAFLKSKQQGDGRFPGIVGSLNQEVVTVALAGLAYAGDARKRYGEEVNRCAKFVADNAGKEESFGRTREPGGPNWNQTNWPLSFGAVFLSELAARQGGSEWKPHVKRMIDQLCTNQETSGGWAHGPGGPNALNYVELEVMSNWALGGIGMAQRIGIGADEGKVLKGIEYVKACTQGGGVAYSTRPGQFGHGDAGRTAGAYWAFRQLARKEAVVEQMATFFERGVKDLSDGHASPVMHVLAGALAGHMRGKSTIKEYWGVYRNYIMASRTHGGAFDARPTAESRQLKSNADRNVGVIYLTAPYAIILQLGQGRYELLDRMK